MDRRRRSFNSFPVMRHVRNSGPLCSSNTVAGLLSKPMRPLIAPQKLGLGTGHPPEVSSGCYAAGGDGDSVLQIVGKMRSARFRTWCPEPFESGVLEFELSFSSRVD
jgi:hypothetical protein